MPYPLAFDVYESKEQSPLDVFTEEVMRKDLPTIKSLVDIPEHQHIKIVPVHLPLEAGGDDQTRPRPRGVAEAHRLAGKRSLYGANERWPYDLPKAMLRFKNGAEMGDAQCAALLALCRVIKGEDFTGLDKDQKVSLEAFDLSENPDWVGEGDLFEAMSGIHSRPLEETRLILRDSALQGNRAAYELYVNSGGSVK